MRKDDYRERPNFLILFFSTIVGLVIAGLLKSSIPSIVPVTIESLQETKFEIIALEEEIRELQELTRERNEYIEVLKTTSDKEKEEIILDNISKLKMAAGFKEMQGPGIIIRMEDNMEDAIVGEDIDLDVVHDADVLRIVNDLRNAGAEAISINGQRVLAVSEIKCGGPIIRINGKSLASPFYISAIGDTKVLNASINAPNTYAYALKHIDQLDIKTKVEENIVIPAYTGRFNFRYARPVKEGD